MKLPTEQCPCCGHVFTRYPSPLEQAILMGGQMPPLKERLWLMSRHCGICGEPIESIAAADLDHIKPRSKGGADNITNLQLTHRSCNRWKGAADIEGVPEFPPA